MNTVSSSNGEVGWITQVEVRIQEVNRDLDYLLSKPNSSEFVTFLATVRARRRGASSRIALRFIYVASFSGECLDSSPKLSAKSILWLNRAHSLIPYQSQQAKGSKQSLQRRMFADCCKFIPRQIYYNRAAQLLPFLDSVTQSQYFLNYSHEMDLKR